MSCIRRTCAPFSSLSVWLIQIASIQTVREVARFLSRLRAASQFSNTRKEVPSSLISVPPSSLPQTYDKHSYLGFFERYVCRSWQTMGEAYLVGGWISRSRISPPDESRGR